MDRDPHIKKVATVTTQGMPIITEPAPTLGPPFVLRTSRRLLPILIGLIGLSYWGAFMRLTLYLGDPFPNVAFHWRKEFKMYIISPTLDYWPGIMSGLQANDRILCIGGFHPSPSSPIYAPFPRYADFQCPNGGRDFATVYQEAWQQGLGAVSFDVDRLGRFLHFESIPLSLFSWQHIFELLLPPVLLSAGFLFISAIVFYANPGTEINVVFAQWGVILAGFVALEAYSMVIGEVFKSARWVAIILVAMWTPFLGVSLYHQSALWSSAARYRTICQRTLPFFYSLSAMVSVIGIVSFLISDTPLGVAMTWPHLGYAIFSALFGLVCGIVVLAWRAVTSTAAGDRWQSGLLLAGLLVAIPTLLLPRVALSFSEIDFPLHLNGLSYTALLVVALIAYAILRFQAIPVRTHGLVYLALFTFCIVVAMVIAVIARNEALFPFLLIACFLVGFGLEWGSRLPPLTRVLRREQYDYAALVELEQEISALQPTEKLIQACNNILRRYLDVADLTVWLVDNDGNSLTRWHGNGASFGQPTAAPIIEKIKHQSAVISYTQPTAALYRDLLTTETPAIAVWAPMTDRGEFVGVMGLAERWTGAGYDQQDFELIGALARQAALAIANTRQLERLAAASRQLQEAQERERLKIAREIHDTILQFMLVLTYGLDDIRERRPEAAAELETWQDQISQQAAELRSLLAYLRAPELLVQQGLVGALHAWLAQVRSMTPVRIEVDLDDEVEEALAAKAKVAIYRVCREAVNNALKHAHATLIEIRLQRDANGVAFCVRDDGDGFDVQAAMAAGGKGYSSLEDMRVQMESVGGGLEIRSLVGAGSEIRGVAGVGERTAQVAQTP